MQFPRYHPHYPQLADHFITPTAGQSRPAIGFPANAGAAVQTTGSNELLHRSTFDRSPGRLGRELQPASTWRGFQSMPSASLSVSANTRCSPGLLSSVVTFDGMFLILIIPKKNLMSSLFSNDLLDGNKPHTFISGHIHQGKEICECTRNH